MTTSFQRLLESKLFTFVVGDAAKRILVHSAAISVQSPVFQAMMEVPMQESIDNTAVLPDVSEDTFYQFCQFAYTGDYDYLLPETPLEAHDDTKPKYKSQVLAELTENPMIRGSGFRKNNKWLSRKDSAQRDFNELRYNSWIPSDRKVPRDILIYQNDANETYVNVYLGYAQLYVFAEKYDIKPLEDCTLKRLHGTLQATPVIGSTRAADIVELIRYTFPNTPDLKDGCDRLRELITFYVVTQVDDILNYDPFLELLQDGGRFVVDFFRMLKEKRLEPF